MSLTLFGKYYDIDIKFSVVFQLKNLNISLEHYLFCNAERGCGFASLVDAAFNYKERLILSGKIHETFDPSYYVKTHPIIYTENISIGDIKVLLINN
jgi:hypothetical protein